MKFIETEFEELINAFYIVYIGCEFKGEDYKSPYQVYAKLANEETLVLANFETAEDASEYVREVIQDLTRG